MITRHRRLMLPDTYPLERIGRLEELLFFDIETTGFSADYSNLYLIGCTYYKDKSWQLIQWFADTAASEEELLHRFFDFLKSYRILIHFNGDRFDLPYLCKRCAKLGLPYNFSGVSSFDIYKKCRFYQKFLGLDRMTQKTVEQFLGIHRQDRYTGGQLIEIYREYLHSRSDYLYDLLILHNAEDLEGMPLILPILNYPDFFEGDLVYENHERNGEWLRIRLNGGCNLPAAFQSGRDPVYADASRHTLTLAIRLYSGTLKHYYPNYKDYYYLIYEDTAIHKSIGEYVDKSARVKATAKTCYTKKEGFFLPQFSPLWEPALKKEPRDPVAYAEYRSACLNDESRRRAYLKQLLDWLGFSRSAQ